MKAVTFAVLLAIAVIVSADRHDHGRKPGHGGSHRPSTSPSPSSRPQVINGGGNPCPPGQRPRLQRQRSCSKGADGVEKCTTIIINTGCSSVGNGGSGGQFPGN